MNRNELKEQAETTVVKIRNYAKDWDASHKPPAYSDKHIQSNKLEAWADYVPLELNAVVPTVAWLKEAVKDDELAKGVCKHLVEKLTHHDGTAEQVRRVREARKKADQKKDPDWENYFDDSPIDLTAMCLPKVNMATRRKAEELFGQLDQVYDTLLADCTEIEFELPEKEFVTIGTLVDAIQAFEAQKPKSLLQK